MADLNWDAYYRSRVGKVEPTKRENVAKAAAEKLAGLEAYQQTLEARSAETFAREKASRQSWVGQLGLDPESVAGKAINAAASGYAGVTRVIGNVGRLPTDIAAASDMQQLSEPQVQAIGRYKQGIATPEDLELINRRTRRVGNREVASNISPLERFERANSARSISRDISDTYNQQRTVEQTNREGLVEDLEGTFKGNAPDISQGWDKIWEGDVKDGSAQAIQGLAGLIAGAVKAGANNKTAVAEYVIENLPQLLVGAVPKAGTSLLTATNVGYASEAYSRGIEKYQRENNGALPPEDVRNRMAAFAASAAIAEQVIDRKLLSYLKGGDPKSAAGKEAVRKGFKDSLKNVGSATATGTAGEALTEGYQTFAEGEASLEPASAQDIYVGGAIGGMTGGAISAGFSTLREAAKPSDKTVKEKEKQDLLEKASATGDVSAFMDPKSETYAPETAVAALFGNTQLETTPQTKKEENLAQGREIVEKLQAEKQAAESVLEASSVEGINKKIAEYQADLATMDPTDPTAVLIAERLEELSAQQKANPDQLKEDQQALQIQVQQIDNRLKQATETLGELEKLVAPVVNQIALINSQPEANEAPEVATQRTKAAEQLITLSMESPVRLDPETATELAENTKNALTAPQRAYLRAFSASRMASNAVRDLGKVSEQVYEGDKNNLGIVSYRDKLGKAMTKGDRKETDRLMGLLARFEEDHRQKSEVAQAALATGAKPQVIKADNQWQINTGERLNDADRKKNGAFNVVSRTLPDAIKAEAEALTALRSELESAYQLKFSAPVEATVVNEEAPASTVEAKSTQSTESTSVQLQSNETITASNTEVDLDSVNQELTVEQNQDSDLDNEVATEVVASTEGQPATLKVLSKKSPEGTAYTARNLVADYFTQVVKKMKTGGALLLRKDFLSAWNNKNVDLKAYLGLKPDEDLTVDESRALDHMRQTLTKWNEKLRDNFVIRKASEGFENRDMMRYLLDMVGNRPDAEENIKTAMSFAGYQWAMLQASSPLKKEPNEIKAMHGKDKSDYLSKKGEAVLNSMAGGESRIISDLGKSALSVLGLKDTKDTPQDLLPKLEQAIGTHILFLLQKEGLIERKFIPTKTVESFFDRAAENSAQDSSTITDPEANAGAVNYAEEFTTYIRLKRHGNEKNRLSQPLREIKEANLRSYDVVTTLFSPEPSTRYATTGPVKFVQQFAKRTKQKISKMQRRVLQATMNTPHKAIPEMLQVAGILTRDRILRIAGHRVDPSLFHADNWESIEAQNQNLERQYDLMMEMLNNPRNKEGTDTEFFVAQEVWKNFRAGFTTQSLNQQTSKIHRFMFARPSWKAELRLDDPVMMEAFKVSVAQAFGLNIDKQKNAKTIEMLESRLADSSNGWMEAINALSNNLFNEAAITDAQADLIASIAEGAEGMMTLQALVAYAKYENAKLRGAETVSIEMLVGADGKTNGPMLTNLALGAASTVENMYSILNRGGMYEKGEGNPTHYAEYKSKPGSKDLYEDLMGAVLKVAKQYFRTPQQIEQLKKEAEKGGPKSDAAKLARKVFTQEQWTAFEAITKELLNEKKQEVTGAGRNLVKTPLTSFNFGSSLGKSVEGMENAFMDSLLTAIEDMAQGKRTDISPTSYVEGLNTLIKMGNPSAEIIPGHGIPALLKTSLSEAQDKAVRKAFKQIMNAPVREAMQGYFGPLIERRTQLNKTIQASFELYNTVYQSMRQQEIDRLVQSGEIASRDSKGKRVPVHDLTNAQEEALRAKLKSLLPVMHTDQSLAEKDSEGGLYLAKNENRPGADDIYQAEVNVAQPFQGASNNPKAARSTKLKSTPVVNWEVSPGVAGTANSAHSIDSSGMHKAIDKVPESMNVHDEIGQGVGKITEAAAAINETIFDTLLDYSPANEAYVTLQRLVQETVERVKSGEITPEVLSTIAMNWASVLNSDVIGPDQVIEHMLTESFNNARAADTIRLGAIAKMGVMDQYPWEGGSFTVTQELRDKATKKLEELATDLSPEMKEAIEFLNEKLQDDLEAKRTKRETTDELDTPVLEGDVLGFPVVKAMGLLESTSQDESLAEDIRAQAKKVLDLMSKKAITLKQAVIDTLEKSDAIRMVETLTQRYGAITSNVWGDLGTPVIASDPRLVSFFEGNPNVTAGRVIEGLARIYSNDTNQPNRKFNFELLGRLKSLVDPDMQVVYVTSTTPESTMLTKANKARGWYASVGNQQAIYVLSDEFVHSGLTAEVLLHELVHAALARKIANESNLTADEKALLSELRELQSAAAAYAESNNIAGFEAALGDLQEFVTWGMTNQAFQRDVLNKVSMESKTKDNALVKGMKVFIEKITALLFKRIDNLSQNGLAILVSNVSALMVDAAKVQPQSEQVITQSMAAVNAVDNYTTVELFDALQSDSRTLDPDFNDKLRGVLNGIVSSLHGPLGSFKDAMNRTAAKHPLAVYLKAVETGKAPFASLLSRSGLKGSPQEDFVAEQVEATVRAALEDNSANSQLTFRKLVDLYTLVRKNLKASDFYDGDWSQAGAYEKSIAQEQYDFLFRPVASNGNKSDYISRFAAWGLANQEGSRLLRVATGRDTLVRDSQVTAQKTFAERLQAILEDILKFFQTKLNRTFKGQDGDLKLEALVGNLVDIEAKKRHHLKQQAAKEFNYLERVEKKAKDATDAARVKIEEMAGSDFFRNSKNSFVRASGSVTRMVAGQRVDLFMLEVAKLTEQHKKGKSVWSGLLTELIGHSERMKLMLRATKGHERERKDVGTNAAKAVLAGFANEGKNLTKEMKSAVSTVFLRSGLHHLTKHFSMKDMEGLLDRNSNDLSKAITDFETRLNSVGTLFKNHFIYEANVLAKYVATNDVNGKFMKKNAHNIVMMYETKYQGQLSPSQYKDAREIVEALVGLYAIGYVPVKDRINALEVLKTENRRDKENGVEFILKVHQRMEQESLERLFGNKPELMLHGYVPEIYNTHTDIRSANEEDGKELLSQGYERGNLLKNDPADPNQEVRHLYFMRDGGLLPRATGVFSYTSKKAKGSALHSGFLNVKNTNGALNAANQAAIAQERQAAIAASFKGGPREDLSKERNNYMAPVFNEQGEVVNWSYLMSASSKDSVLDRDNRFEKVMGALASSIYDKETSREQNRVAIKALKEQYNDEYKKDPARYVLVGHASKDPELREIWGLLSQDTRNDVRAIWGEGGMMVRADSLDILFGYRKLSAGSVFKTAMKERQLNATLQAAGYPPLSNSDLNLLEKTAVSTVEGVLRMYARYHLNLSADEAEQYTNRAAKLVIQGERGWQEVVREVKDLIVVKTGIVLLNNIISNTWILVMSGVPAVDIAKHHLVAMKSTSQYWADAEELKNLERLVDTGYTQGNDREIQDQILRLKDAIERNPVTPLIRAGLMPTIVEDVAADDDPHSYKSALTRKLEKASAKVNPGIVSAAKTVYMAHDTRAYQALSRLTQMSDFVGRYVMYQHLTTKKIEPLTEAEAIQKASDYFINYDIPMHRSLQYIDDMGFIPFMKYFLRIQKVIIDIFANNPGRVLTFLALNNYMSLGPNVLESSILSRFGNNPLRGGALEFPGLLPELGTVNATMALIK